MTSETDPLVAALLSIGTILMENHASLVRHINAIAVGLYDLSKEISDK